MGKDFKWDTRCTAWAAGLAAAGRATLHRPYRIGAPIRAWPGRRVRRLDRPAPDPPVERGATIRWWMRPCAVSAQPRRRHPLERNTDRWPRVRPDPDDVTLAREAVRVLRRLCETGAVLAVAAEMDKAVVVRDGTGGGDAYRVVEATVAQAMALRTGSRPRAAGGSNATRSPAGPPALAGMMGGATGESGPGGAGEAFRGIRCPRRDACRAQSLQPGRKPACGTCPPSRSDGKAFLGDALVQAGERLREDFELAQMGARVTQNWDQFPAPAQR